MIFSASYKYNLEPNFKSQDHIQKIFKNYHYQKKKKFKGYNSSSKISVKRFRI